MCSEFGVCGFMTRERDLEERDVRDEQWENTPPHTVWVRKSSPMVKRL